MLLFGITMMLQRSAPELIFWEQLTRIAQRSQYAERCMPATLDAIWRNAPSACPKNLAEYKSMCHKRLCCFSQKLPSTDAVWHAVCCMNQAEGAWAIGGIQLRSKACCARMARRPLDSPGRWHEVHRPGPDNGGRAGLLRGEEVPAKAPPWQSATWTVMPEPRMTPRISSPVPRVPSVGNAIGFRWRNQ